MLGKKEEKEGAKWRGGRIEENVRGVEKREVEREKRHSSTRQSKEGLECVNLSPSLLPSYRMTFMPEE